MSILRLITLFTIVCGVAIPVSASDLKSEIIFPFQDEHVHGSTIVALSNGDLLTAWFQGSGERWADDVRIMGARKKSGKDSWSEPFLMADVPAFPDINPILFMDGKDRLWLMWYTVLANQWETSLLKYRISENYLTQSGAPEWDWQADLLVKPGDKTERGIQPGDSFVESVQTQVQEYGKYLKKSMNREIVPEEWMRHGERLIDLARGENMIRSGRVYKDDGTYENKQLGYPHFRRLGWQTRNKPFITDSHRMIVPLYSDGFSFSLMAYTDNWGETWEFSNPLVGAGNIQPAIARSENGDLVAYMRDNGPPPNRLHMSRSTDNGKTWGPVRDSSLLNPGAAADIVTLRSGDWILINNDTEDGRHRLSVVLSENGGKTWPFEKVIELDKGDEPTTAHYPAIVQAEDGSIHVTYSYHRPGYYGDERKTIKYATFGLEWLKSSN